MLENRFEKVEEYFWTDFLLRIVPRRSPGSKWLTIC